MGRINLTVDDGLHRELEAVATERGVDASDLVREAIENLVRDRTPPTSFLDAARRLGVIGCVVDAPPDLSTNRDHFKGFGESRS